MKPDKVFPTCGETGFLCATEKCNKTCAVNRFNFGDKPIIQLSRYLKRSFDNVSPCMMVWYGYTRELVAYIDGHWYEVKQDEGE